MEDAYQRMCTEPSDINEHIPTLYEYAKRCERITELGTRACVSTWAFLKGLADNGSSVKKLVSIDIEYNPNVDYVKTCAASVVDYTFIASNDLERTPDQTDMTFVDTWHVYAQLKRELALYAPVTKKYIVMHDTTVDAEDGESIRCGLDSRQQSIESGFSEDEIRQGLRRAIDEFLSWNDDWVVDNVFTNNNGLTILRRKQPLFLVTSVIHMVPCPTNMWQSTVYTPVERYDQTLRTIESIRAVVPFAHIIVLEGSRQRVMFDTADQTIHIPVAALQKSVGDATLLKTFLEKNSVEQSSIVFKLSGRYTLAPDFDIRRFSRTKMTFNNCVVDWSPNADRTISLTMLFSFVPSVVNTMIQRLTLVQESEKPYIEGDILYGCTDFKNIERLGVHGTLAPTGEFVEK